MRWVVALCAVTAMVIPAKRALHMFQQNRYELPRYTQWLKGDLASADLPVFPILIAGAGVLTAIVMANRIGHFILSLLCLLIFYYYYSDEKVKSYIKPLVFTGRVKRQICVMAVMITVYAVISAVFANRFTMAALMAMTVIMPWLLIYPMALLTTPVENAIKKMYLNEAKKILRGREDLIKIGITGSYGKTTTKNIVRSILSYSYNTLMTPASYNTPMGITRTVREMLKPIHRVFVCEMGADHVGEITDLMNFVKPSIGIVTAIGPQHLATFFNQENIIREKMQMIEMLDRDGLGILNYDNDFIRAYDIKNPVKIVTYGIDHEADYMAEDITFSPQGSSFTVKHGDERMVFQTRLLGKLNILNILAAIICARYLEVPWKTIQTAVRSMDQVEHRLQLKTIGGYRFIDDAFNANPSGARMALEVLAMMPNKRVVVTPGMIDLGPRQDEVNRAFGAEMKGRADMVILVGKNQTQAIVQGLEETGFAKDSVLVVDKVKEAFAYIYQNFSGEDTILLENDLPDAFNR